MVDTINGYTKSIWKSLVIKSLRIGWVTGLQKAREVLSKSEMNSLLIGGIFEDIFPDRKDLPEILNSIKNEDYETLCSFETHHGRNYSEQFCDLEQEAVENRNTIYPQLKQVTELNGTFIAPRLNNCVYTWLKINPTNSKKRNPYFKKWEGMPKVIIDGHTYEGKVRRIQTTKLSGHYHIHREIGQEVSKNGWTNLRQTLNDIDIQKPTKNTLNYYF